MELGVVVVIAALALVFLRVPIGVAFIVPSVVYIVITGVPVVTIAQRTMYSVNSYTILAVPLFIFVGSLLNQSGITDRIFEFTNHLVGHVSGGLAHVNIVASLIFSGMSGAALADVGGIGRMLIYAMDENGYERDYAAGLTSASATVGPIFPPSIPLIIFGLVGQVSIVSLFLAGVIPAILSVLLLMGFTAYLARKRNFPTSESDISLRKTGKSFAIAFPALLTPIVLISGMLTGAFGPTEIAAVTCVYVIAINVLLYGNRDVSYIFDASVEAVRSTSVIMFPLIGAALFGWVLTVEQIPNLVSNILFSVSTNPLVILLILNIVILVIGLFLETVAALLMLTPIFLPAVIKLGIDPIHFGVIMVFNLMIGLLTPPLGLSVYLSSDIADVPVENVIKQVSFYYVPLVLTLLLITFFPSIVLWLPKLVN
ncbi:TRAP transporter large permease [Haloferax profundi]|uniref:ABC transporter permease n=1 Tax=Haloferax profundi TaxID=1544718 RepID=A0A0W1RFB7_9EURY|nr:TRAP transporter large permease [Haloferax profundi]KTG12232.1 ABC transporter permease [Haloferax profundi]